MSQAVRRSDSSWYRGYRCAIGGPQGRRHRVAVALIGTIAAHVSGCATWNSAPTLPSRDTVTREQLVFHADFRLPRYHRLLEDLTAQRTYVSNTLDLPVSDEPIHLYLFEKSYDYREFLRERYPGVPERRALFVEEDTRMTVYAHWGDRVAQDLRHEVTHGYVHAVIRSIPLWLDEGLAEYFEVPQSDSGLHQQHMEALVAAIAQDAWQPNLPRLERLSDISDMRQIDYAESWLWVHMLLNTSDQRRRLLHGHLDGLCEGAVTPPLSILLRAEPGIEEELLIHLEKLR